MKMVRLLTFLLVGVLVFSAWPPSPVLASADAATASIAADSVSANVDFAAVKQVKLTITNNTGGTIYITLTGYKYYSFAATKQGKNIFLIDKGKYTAKLRASTCGGTITKKINGAGSLGTYRCKKSKKG